MKRVSRKIAIFLFVFAMAASASISLSPISGHLGSVSRVEAASASKVSLSDSKITVVKGATATLKMSGLGKKDTVSWSISPKSYGTLTVSKDTKSCKVTATKSGATVTAKVNGKKYTCKVTVTSVKMSKDTLSLKQGKADVISLSGTTTAAKWSVDNKKVATIKKVGKNKYRVTAVGKGTTYVKAKIGSKTYKTKVTVTVPTALSKTSVSIKYGTTYTLKLNNASGGVVWSVDEDASDIVSIKTSGKKNTGTSCTVTPKLVGSSYVYAVCGGKTYRCKVTVKAVSSPKISKKSISLSQNGTCQLKVTGQKVDDSITWSTTSKKVATVSKSGKVTAKGVGQCTVSATVDGVVLKCKVVVSETLPSGGESGSKETESTKETEKETTKQTEKETTKQTEKETTKQTEKETAKQTEKETTKQTESEATKVTRVSLNNTTLSLNVGDTATLKATVSPDTASNKSVEWSSSNTLVAMVSASGKVTAKKSGSATITCKAADGSGKSATCKVTVSEEVTEESETSGGSDTGTGSGSMEYTYDLSECMDISLNGGSFDTFNVYTECPIEKVEFISTTGNASAYNEKVGYTSENERYISVMIYGDAKGSDVIKIYCEGVLLKECKVTVLSDDAEYLGYENWRKNIIEPEIWKDCTTDEEKIDAAAAYARSHEYSTSGTGSRFPFYNGGTGDGKGSCETGNGFVVDCAKDLGLTAYVGDGTSGGTDNHVMAYVQLKTGELYIVDGTPMVGYPG